MVKSPLSPLTKTKLRNWILKGETYSDIGKRYGVTRQAVFQRALSFGLKGIRSNILDRRNNKIIKMHNRKVPVKEIAEKFNLSPVQVYLIIRKNREI